MKRNILGLFLISIWVYMSYVCVLHVYYMYICAHMYVCICMYSLLRQTVADNTYIYHST